MAVRMLVMATHDYRQIIANEYQRRHGRNAHYSLRAFARDLGLSAPRLNEVLSGKKGLSATSALGVGRALELSSDELEGFLLSVEARHCRSQAGRKSAAEKLKVWGERREREPVLHTTVVHWTTEAVQKLCERAGFRPTPESVASALGVPLYLASSPIRYLRRAGLLPGQSSESPLAYIANRLRGKRINVDYEQILELAKQAFQSAETAHGNQFMHEPLLLTGEQVSEVQEILNRARKQILKQQSKERSARLYYLSTQFFKIENERKEK